MLTSALPLGWPRIRPQVGSLAIDMCCRCGVFVLDSQPAVACEHCVDVYHLQCQGLKAVPEGEWVSGQ